MAITNKLLCPKCKSENLKQLTKESDLVYPYPDVFFCEDCAHIIVKQMFVEIFDDDLDSKIHYYFDNNCKEDWINMIPKIIQTNIKYNKEYGPMQITNIPKPLQDDQEILLLLKLFE